MRAQNEAPLLYKRTLTAGSNSIKLWRVEDMECENALLQEQPAPEHSERVAVWDLVIKDMHDRNAQGTAKYGTPLQAFNGRNALWDAYQEALDLCVYLRQRIEEDGGKQFNKGDQSDGKEMNMPGPISESSKGPGPQSPYVPSWCYTNGPKLCPCGHHEGYHADDGQCLLRQRCLCTGLPGNCRTPLAE